MHLWDGLFRTRSADSPGNSPATPQLFGASHNTLRHAASRTPGSSSITSSGTAANPQQQRWHSTDATSSNTDSSHYQQQLPRSLPDIAGNAGSSSSSSQPVQIPEAKVLPYSRLRSSISPSPTQTLLSGNESPGTEPLLGAAAAAAGQPAQVYISSGSNAQMQPQSNNLILRGQNRNKRPPPCPSPQAKPQNLSSTAASSSSSNIQASPRRSSSSNATWVPQVSSSSNLAAYSSPVGSSSSLWAGNSRVLGYSTGPGGLAGSGGGVSPGVLASSYGGLAYGSSGSRRHQQLLSNALQSASPSPTGEGLLAASLNLSPASAAAAAAVGEAVTAVAGNPHHPHHQQTMQLLLQHQQLQMHHLQQQQLQQAAVDIPGRLGGGFLYPVGDYYGSVGAQPLPQSPEVLLRRSSSSSRLAELGTSPGLIEASFMGLAARPRNLTHSNSFTAASSSNSRRTTQQRMQQAEYSAARQQQQDNKVIGSRGSSAAGSPKGSQSGSGASLADWDGSNKRYNTTNNLSTARQQGSTTDTTRDLSSYLDRCITPTADKAAAAPAAAATASLAGPAANVVFDRDSSSSSLEHLLQDMGRASSSTPTSISRDILVTDSVCRSSAAVPGQRGGLKVLPGQPGLHWISRTDDAESAARGLLGLPRPGILNPTSSEPPPLPQQQQRGLVRSESPGHRSSGSLGEIEVSDADLDLGSTTLAGSGSSRDPQAGPQQQQQQQQGFSGFTGGSMRRSASHGALMATPAKIGEGPVAAAAAAAATPGSWGGRTAAPAAAWMADGSSSSKQAPLVSRRVSFKQAAAALAAAPGTSPTSSAAAAAVEDELLRQDSFTSTRSAENYYNQGSPTAAAAAAAPGAEQLQPGASIRVSPRASPRASPATATAAYTPNGSSPYQSRSFSRRSNNGFGMPRSSSTAGYPTCLICLDQLTPEDFENGEALQLDCRCKGEVALRHRQCAEKWSRIKGNTICDVCKAPILNLPEVPPLPVPPGQGLGNQAGGLLGPGADSGLWGSEEPPAVADYIFDCIRVTWVVLIVCILFFELSVSRAFLTGALIGSAYVALAASWSAAQRRRRQNRLAAAAPAAGWMGQQGMQEQRVPLLQGQVGGIEGLPV